MPYKSEWDLPFFIPQLRLIPKVKKGTFPSLGTFSLGDARVDPRNAELLDRYRKWLTLVAKYRASFRLLATNTETPKSHMNKYLDSVTDSTKDVVLRCCHSVIHPNMYRTDRYARDALFLYWQVACCLNADLPKDVEIQEPGKPATRFFAFATRRTTNDVAHSYEYYDALSTFANLFPFNTTLDRDAFSLFADGVPIDIIALTLGAHRDFLKSRLTELVSLAIAYRVKTFGNLDD